MKGDFSRWKFDRNKNFSGVLHQQGRVLLDNDWNIQTIITNNWQDQAGRDAIGPGVAAVPADESLSFKVKSAKAIPVNNPKKVELTITPGRIWADGLLTYLPGRDPDTPADVRRTATYLRPPIQDPHFDESTIGEGIRDAVILEVWREAINGFQIPDELIEPALGGPDTTEKVYTATAFRLLRLADGDTCHNIRDRLRDDFSKKGKLKVTLQPTTTTPGECPVVKGGGYTGFEHQLYRAEIAQVNSGVAMFKWSQFNGGLVGRGDCDLGGSNKKITITANDQAIKMSGLNTFYLEVVEFDPDQGYWRATYGAEVTLNGDDLDVTTQYYTDPALQLPSGRTFFRLWNGIRPIADFPKVTAPTEPNELRDGIRLEFDPAAGANYVPGDYWTFPVRAGEINNLEVLIDEEPPEGIRYHRVPLAVLNWNDTRDVSHDIAKKEIQDCRDIFRSLTNQTVCCTYTVGDGKVSHGDFDSIEAAVMHLPKSGGEICLLPGLHEANVQITGKRYIKIRGCDRRTTVVPKPTSRKAPIFHVKDSQVITLENMDMATLEGTAIRLEASKLGKLREVEIRNNRVLAFVNAVRVDGGEWINIHNNKIRILDKPRAGVAIFMMAEDSVIERNDIGVIPAKWRIPPFDGIPSPLPFPDPTDPCTDPEKVYENRTHFIPYLYRTWEVPLASIPFAANVATTLRTLGGIQIAGTSERIKICENRISGGSGNGITLGHIPAKLDNMSREVMKRYFLLNLAPAKLSGLKESFQSFLYDIVIEENEIRNMGLNGIGVVSFFSLDRIGLIVSVEDLSIYRNVIENCLQQIPRQVPEVMEQEMGFGGISLSDCENVIIRENRIENNGTGHLEPVSGIFILHGEKVDISDNRILDNGPRKSRSDVNIRSGMRGGIVIGLSFKKVISELLEDKEWLYQDGIPAAKVHDNIVVQPTGRALSIMAFGPVSVVGNQLTSCGGDFKADPKSLLGAAVLIVDLGISKDLVGRLLSSTFKNLALASTRRMYVTRNAPDVEMTTATHAQPSLLALLYLPSGNVLFANNQTTLDLRAPEINFAFSSQFIASLDDISYVGNQSECASLLDHILSNTVVYGVTVRTNDNRFQEGVTVTNYSLISYGFMNTSTTNQATHCLHVLGHRDYKVDAHNRVLMDSNCGEAYKKLAGIYMVPASKK